MYNEMGLIKSPLSYTGEKFKILKDIYPLFPDNIHTFVDLFGGGFNVGVNIDAETIIYNDTLTPIVTLLKYMYITNTKKLLKELQGYIDEYKLNKENSDGYFELRKHYNLSEEKHPMELYALICHGFNNQIRFNSKGKFNIPFGKREFNPTLKEKFIDFVREMHNKKIVFTNENFVNLKIDKLHDNSFIYIDPPYLGSTTTYKEQGGWTEEDESALLSLLNRLSERGIAWALSNNLKYKNPLLEAFLDSTEGIKLHHLNSYCGDSSDDNVEILVTNY